MMVTYGKDFGGSEEPPESPNYVRPMESNLEILIRILGVITAIIVCGVGADIAYHRHVMGYYVTVASALIFFLEITWAITLFVQICLRNDESHCSRCWLSVLMVTRGWRRVLFYLPLSCILAWKPHNLWLSFVAAGLLAALSLLYVISSALSQRGSARTPGDSMGESLLHTRPEAYDRFEEVLVTEVLDDGVSGPTSDGEM
ncbi:uncharacterized protein LOC107041449 [Diachasma alloeum]|uniref:uncharacterized protein LOC107041449 n=1 Tax=Diachasma alloeum TaxID=454923 RepID=UPI000738335D|nr:uncharacterized protein LOC107041449 [Diachasma alloeum]